MLTSGFDGWTFLPSAGQVVGEPAGRSTSRRTARSSPSPVGGDIKLATFNVLNYFPTTGAEFTSAPLNGTCTLLQRPCRQPDHQQHLQPRRPPRRRRRCQPAAPAGQDRHAINGLGASIVSLEEIENSAKYGKNRDFARPDPGRRAERRRRRRHVGLRAARRSPRTCRPWRRRTSSGRPSSTSRPRSRSSAPPRCSYRERLRPAFDNAREPLAQGFKGVGQPDAKAFAVIVNHFKSKGSGNRRRRRPGQRQRPTASRRPGALKTFAADFTAQLDGIRRDLPHRRLQRLHAWRTRSRS